MDSFYAFYGYSLRRVDEKDNELDFEEDETSRMAGEIERWEPDSDLIFQKYGIQIENRQDPRTEEYIHFAVVKYAYDGENVTERIIGKVNLDTLKEMNEIGISDDVRDSIRSEFKIEMSRYIQYIYFF